MCFRLSHEEQDIVRIHIWMMNTRNRVVCKTQKETCTTVKTILFFFFFFLQNFYNDSPATTVTQLFTTSNLLR